MPSDVVSSLLGDSLLSNRSKEKQEYEDSIVEDLARLNVYPDHQSYTSDHFEVMLQFARKLIAEGKAYMDDTPLEQMRQERMDGIEGVHKYVAVLWRTCAPHHTPCERPSTATEHAP